MADVITPISTLEKLQAALLQIKRMDMQIDAQADTIRKLRETRETLTSMLATALPYVECWESRNGFEPGGVTNQARKIRAALEAA